MTMEDRAGAFELDSEDSGASMLSMWIMFSALIFDSRCSRRSSSANLMVRENEDADELLALA